MDDELRKAERLGSEGRRLAVCGDGVSDLERDILACCTPAEDHGCHVVCLGTPRAPDWRRASEEGSGHERARMLAVAPKLEMQSAEPARQKRPAVIVAEQAPECRWRQERNCHEWRWLGGFVECFGGDER